MGDMAAPDFSHWSWQRRTRSRRMPTSRRRGDHAIITLTPPDTPFKSGDLVAVDLMSRFISMPRAKD